ncbi:ABC transporter ATP-binding protein [Streptomonospora nanhaiensis]|uniref:ABC transporter ATP-binding protein n=1 Tax=Streptomonospora nanhaiensis TaxID=1323731 RepID=UPI001C389954|nr:ABC transporter ATP-binding protein [Streptomonospora nanhaiensis]MBV2364643.1 ABC transporter ATP-binding protein/permease [Streptomonospora nanhaiensis]MBX9388705.1 ABC transporter ATP-binding protein/permease [Streptomonospora nanhaiensis]
MTAREQDTAPAPEAARAGRRLPVADARQVARAVRAALGGRWWALAGVAAILTAGAAADLIAPAALGGLVDAVQSGESGTAWLWRLGAAMVVGALVGAVLTAAGVVTASRLYETVIARLREQMVARAFELPQGMVEEAGSGDLVSRATDDVAEISQAAPRIVPALTGSLFTIAVTVVGIAVVDYRYALAVAVIVPVHVFAVRWYLRNAPQVYAAQRAAMAERAHHLLTSLHGIETVHAYRLQDRHNGRIARASWEVVGWELRARVVQNRFFGRLNAAELLGMTGLLVVGYLLVTNDLGTLGGATTAIMFFIRLFNPINNLLIVIDDLQSALASLARIVGVIDALPDPRDPCDPSRTGPADAAGEGAGEAGSAAAPAAGPAVPSADTGGNGPVLALKDVEFHYDPARPVLSGVSLEIGRTETVALVGASGAGKSTVAALAAGVHEPTAGTVRRPPATPQRDRDLVLITQEVHVFAATLRENLTLAAPSADDDQVRAALTTVGADTLLARLPEGLDTVVGTEGHSLTPAEAQLLALARMVLADPAVAILDEATAEAGSAHAGALDSATAAALSGRAGLVVAHRLDQAKACDRILVIESGRIIEEGTHDGLRARGGTYATLWEAWSRKAAQ